MPTQNGGVALIQELSGHLTIYEDQLQFVLQVVADHRKQYPQVLKKTLTESKEWNLNVIHFHVWHI